MLTKEQYFINVIDFWGELLAYKSKRKNGSIRITFEVCINTKWEHRRLFLNNIVKGNEYNAQGDTIQLRYRNLKQLNKIMILVRDSYKNLIHKEYWDALEMYLSGNKKEAFTTYKEFKNKYGERKK